MSLSQVNIRPVSRPFSFNFAPAPVCAVVVSSYFFNTKFFTFSKKFAKPLDKTPIEWYNIYSKGKQQSGRNRRIQRQIIGGKNHV